MSEFEVAQAPWSVPEAKELDEVSAVLERMGLGSLHLLPFVIPESYNYILKQVAERNELEKKGEDFQDCALRSNWKSFKVDDMARVFSLSKTGIERAAPGRPEELEKHFEEKPIKNTFRIRSAKNAQFKVILGLVAAILWPGHEGFASCSVVRVTLSSFEGDAVNWAVIMHEAFCKMCWNTVPSDRVHGCQSYALPFLLELYCELELLTAPELNGFELIGTLTMNRKKRPVRSRKSANTVEGSAGERFHRGSTGIVTGDDNVKVQVGQRRHSDPPYGKAKSSQALAAVPPAVPGELMILSMSSQQDSASMKKRKVSKALLNQRKVHFPEHAESACPGHEDMGARRKKRRDITIVDEVGHSCRQMGSSGRNAKTMVACTEDEPSAGETVKTPGQAKMSNEIARHGDGESSAPITRIRKEARGPHSLSPRTVTLSHRTKNLSEQHLQGAKFIQEVIKAARENQLYGFLLKHSPSESARAIVDDVKAWYDEVQNENDCLHGQIASLRVKLDRMQARQGGAGRKTKKALLKQ